MRNTCNNILVCQVIFNLLYNEVLNRSGLILYIMQYALSASVIMRSNLKHLNSRPTRLMPVALISTIYQRVRLVINQYRKIIFKARIRMNSLAKSLYPFINPDLNPFIIHIDNDL